MTVGRASALEADGRTAGDHLLEPVVVSTTSAAAYLLLTIARGLTSALTRFIAVTKIRPSAMVGLTASTTRGGGSDPCQHRPGAPSYRPRGVVDIDR